MLPIFLLAITLAVAEFTTFNDVLVLDDKNFEEALSTYDQLLVEFFAPVCVVCFVHLIVVY